MVWYKTFLVDGAVVKPRITMPTTATIRQLKEQIEEYTGVPVSRQILTYKYNTKLIDDFTINQYDFSLIPTILLQVEKDPEQMDVNITVTSEAFKVSLKVHQMETVMELKQRIGQMWGIETKDITLSHISTIMKDDHFLHMYYVIEGSDVKFTRTGHYS
ncbi:ubiquitin domain-containing protein [Cephalotus follicularis]|uniref:Ubiquitin domain-containing protein n=1 Tax=Cephalotus follicularis TaxID=3775 RepID=A0A1Q3CM28_CEPFO|nr:ubiquitin domain-containing protein [Cephalotus follicularis]